jgi:hypothetical protein
MNYLRFGDVRPIDSYIFKSDIAKSKIPKISKSNINKSKIQ